ncbi:unnamed protein product [Sphagnum jensenii]
MDQQQQHEDDDDTFKCRDLAGLHKSLVQEAQVLHGLVCTIVASKGEVEPATFKKAEAVIEKYQEQGQLLEPHLESLITPLMGIIRAMVTKVDSKPLTRRVVRSFLHFLSSVQAAPGVESEGIEVAAQCLSEVFKLNQ